MKILYKNNIEEVIERQRRFFSRQMPNQVLARIFVKNYPFEKWLTRAKKTISLNDKNFPPKEVVFKTWDLKLRIFKEINDDSLPVMVPTEFDEGFFGGIFGAETDFSFDAESGWLSSMARPFLADYEDLDKLRIKENNLWMRELRERLSWYRKQAAGKFGISPIISIDALNFTVMARGATRAMMDIYDSPTQLQNLYEFALKINVKLNKLQKKILGFSNNGTFDGYACFGAWFPGDEINISVDAFGQCRKEVYAKMGLEYTQRLIDAFGSAFLHIHGNADHLLPEIVKLKGLKGIWICDEPPHPFPRLAEIKKITGDIPLVTECMLDEFLKSMKKGELPGGIFYIIRGHKEGRSTLFSPAVETVAEANRIMKEIRGYKTSR